MAGEVKLRILRLPRDSGRDKIEDSEAPAIPGGIKSRILRLPRFREG
jgi:hypothetical protein